MRPVQPCHCCVVLASSAIYFASFRGPSSRHQSIREHQDQYRAAGGDGRVLEPELRRRHRFVEASEPATENSAEKIAR